MVVVLVINQRVLHKASQQSVHLTCGSLRGLQAFFWLRVFPAPKQSPRPPHAGNASRWLADAKEQKQNRLWIASFVLWLAQKFKIIFQRRCFSSLCLSLVSANKFSSSQIFIQQVFFHQQSFRLVLSSRWNRLQGFWLAFRSSLVLKGYVAFSWQSSWSVL